ncbi:hypothetical protein LguiB_006522 [Lonicera macranthoides]
MAIALINKNMNNQDHHHHEEQEGINNKLDDQHEHDLVMPGFRFHPTEEELVEFYLRRKVEGKRFNVELITFLDLYRYDPWELPALAAIGEKEWYFYVPRDRKYRNGDRPNRVTTSGYWKATGADRMIRTENFRSIGLKKTLVFYSGKAPKGIRTSWIMNEYRLPHHETERLQKAEISLCRVYKRAGVEDHPSLPRSLPTRASSSSSRSSNSTKIRNPPIQNFQSQQIDESSRTSGSSNTNDAVATALGLSNHSSYTTLLPLSTTTTTTTLVPQASSLVPNCTSIFSGPSSSFASPNGIDELHRLINYQQVSITQQQEQQQYHNHNHQHTHFLQFSNTNNLQPQIGTLPAPSPLQATFSDRLWEWSESVYGTPSILPRGTPDP